MRMSIAVIKQITKHVYGGSMDMCTTGQKFERSCKFETAAQKSQTFDANKKTIRTQYKKEREMKGMTYLGN